MSTRWAQRCTALFLKAVDQLDDDEFDTATALPGWTRRHVVAHVASNAEALGRLVQWARTGRPHPMYASPEQRSASIERGVALPTSDLRSLVRETAEDLLAGFDALPEASWSAQVVTAQGRTVPASEIPWLRVRETAVHAVDLDASVRFADLDTDVLTALIDDVAAWRTARGGPALTLSDGVRTWTVPGAGEPISVVRTPAELAAWLTGRTSGAGLPPLSSWL